MFRKRLYLLISLLVSLPGAAGAAPVLRPEVTVTAAVVTVGDLFEDAGPLSGQPIFRSPPLGTSGFVSRNDIAAAADRLGLAGYTVGTIDQVRVSRAGTMLDEALLADLIVADLRTRGIVGPDMSVQLSFSQPVVPKAVETAAEPVRISDLRYHPANGRFSARFLVAGEPNTFDVSGSADLTIAMPHLAENLKAGAILEPRHIVMRHVPLHFADGSGVLELADVLGKQLQRGSRGGVMLKPADLGEPQLIMRNEPVTLYYRQGPLTLTVKGQALGNAAAGQPVDVLNTMSNRVITGVALAKGAVEVSSPGALLLAGLE